MSMELASKYSLLTLTLAESGEELVNSHSSKPRNNSNNKMCNKTEGDRERGEATFYIFTLNWVHSELID